MARRPVGVVPAIRIDIAVEAGAWPSRRSLTNLAKKAVATVLRRVKPRLPPDGELSLLFTDDRHIRALNRRYRKKDKPTNVLSFPAAGGGPFLGDLALSFETIAREAEELDLNPRHHLTHLIVHGFLHLLGHDHENDREAGVMEGLETTILAELGIADPYGKADR